MLVQDFVMVPLPLEEVERRLARSNGRSPWAAAAFKRGERLAVGPGIRGIAAEVELDVGEPLRSVHGTSIPFSWRARGSSLLFPHLDAEMVLTPLGDGLTQLCLRGSYQPPLNSLGAMLDRLAMHRLAEATVRNFLERLSVALSEGSERDDRAEDGAAAG